MCDQQRIRSACAYVQSYQSLCLSLEYSRNVNLQTKHLLEVLSLKKAAQARLSLHLNKCQIVGNLMPWHIILFQLYHFSCEQDSNLMGSDFDNEESGVPSIKRYWAVLYVFKFYNSNDIFFSCTVTVCPSGSSSCDIVSLQFK